MSSSGKSFNQKRLCQLTLERCSSSLDEADMQELSAILATSEEARTDYSRFMLLHSALQGFGEDAATHHLRSSLATFVQKHSNVDSTRIRNYLRLAVAASLLLAFFGASYLWLLSGENQRLAAAGGSNPISPSPVLATITPLVSHANWSLGRPDGVNQKEIQQGDMVWAKEGVLELRLVNNTAIVLESPVMMQVVSVDRVRVMDGGIKVDVPKGAEGFTVESDVAEVVDQGTSFSVRVDDGDTDVVVFDGEVDLNTKSQSSKPAQNNKKVTRRFSAGEAVRVASDGTLSRVVQVQQSPLGDGQAREEVEPLISSVTDNIEREDFYRYYEIVPRGFGEDASAYVDRHHQWNGRSIGDPIPDQLRGADYFRTFNDDRLRSDYHLNVTLTAPARLYILLDLRNEVPDWIRKEFIQTSSYIGIDEGWTEERRLGRQTTDVGSGKSIDNRAGIFYKDVLEPGVVQLGAVPRHDDANMYGVAAVPLQSALAQEPLPMGPGMSALLWGLPDAVGEVSVERVPSFSDLTIASPSSTDRGSPEFSSAFKVALGGGEYSPHVKTKVVDGTFPQLSDGLLSRNDDDLERNAWYDREGRFYLDLKSPTEVREIAAFSWHRGARAPQFFSVWGSNEPQMPSTSFYSGDDAAKAGWKLLGVVDSRNLGYGGVHASVVRGTEASLGTYRHLLWVVERLGRQGTFFTEIDVHGE